MVKLTVQNREQYATSILEALNAGEIQTFRELFFDLHVQDQTDLYKEMQDAERQRLYTFLSPTEYAEIFEELEIDDQKTFIEDLELSYAQDVISEMATDDAADFLGEIQESEARVLIEGLDKQEAADLNELLGYEEFTAGSIMTKDFIRLQASSQIEEVIALLRQEGPEAETIYYLYVVNNKDELVGVVSLRDLITSEPDKTVEEVMSTRVVSVLVNEDQEEVANLFRKYNFLAVPVITDHRTLLGIITVDDIMDVMDEEALEDLDDFAASSGTIDLNITSFTAARKRAPWIILLMFFGMISANIISQFEETLEAIVLLAGFIPLIMGSAGNAGTQSLAVAVRSLAMGTIEKKNIMKMVLREFGTGLQLGVICAAVLFILIPFLHGSYFIAMVVGLSIFISLSLATVIGTIIPLFINKLKLDPAIASGPFITTINDITGLMIYFTVATTMLTYL